MPESWKPWLEQHLVLLIISATVLTGLFVAVTLALLVRMLTAPISDENEPFFERQRRIRLRQGNGTYRTLEAAVHGLEPTVKANMAPTIENLDRNLLRVREALPWRGEEYVAVAILEGSLAGLFIYLASGMFLDLWLLGIIPGIATVVLYVFWQTSTIATRAEQRRRLFRSRLPFAVELLALVLEAGASLLQGLQTVARENRGHPLGEELNWTLHLVSTGRPLREALQELHTRIDDPDLQELIQAIIHGDEMGSPMARVLSVQAEQMRLKRSQWSEKVASEAQAQIVYPGLVVMLACIFIIAAPFVAQFLTNFY